VDMVIYQQKKDQDRNFLEAGHVNFALNARASSQLLVTEGNTVLRHKFAIERVLFFPTRFNV